MASWTSSSHCWGRKAMRCSLTAGQGLPLYLPSHQELGGACPLLGMASRHLALSPPHSNSIPDPWRLAWCHFWTPSWLCSSPTPMSATHWAPVSIHCGGASVKKWPGHWARRACGRCSWRSWRVRAGWVCSVLDVDGDPVGLPGPCCVLDPPVHALVCSGPLPCSAHSP